MESKGIDFTRVMYVNYVIIEPHWNLKLRKCTTHTATHYVIIEPHWNLKNTEKMIKIARFLGNNRTTLESKVKYSPSISVTKCW